MAGLGVEVGFYLWRRVQLIQGLLDLLGRALPGMAHGLYNQCSKSPCDLVLEIVRSFAEFDLSCQFLDPPLVSFFRPVCCPSAPFVSDEAARNDQQSKDQKYGPEKGLGEAL